MASGATIGEQPLAAEIRQEEQRRPDGRQGHPADRRGGGAEHPAQRGPVECGAREGELERDPDEKQRAPQQAAIEAGEALVPPADDIGDLREDHRDQLVEENAAILVSLPIQFHERWLAWSEIAEGWLEIRRGGSGGDDRIQRARQKLFGIGVRGYQSLLAAMTATGRLRAGRYDEASALLEDGLTLISETGECWCEAEMHRLCGELRLARAMQQRRGTKRWQQLAGEAEACLRHALEVARAQGAKWWQLRAAVSLARLLGECDRSIEARQLLTDAHGGLNEGFDLPDLRAAQELLKSLGD